MGAFGSSGPETYSARFYNRQEEKQCLCVLKIQQQEANRYTFAYGAFFFFPQIELKQYGVKQILLILVHPETVGCLGFPSEI